MSPQSPQSHASNWGSPSPATLNDAMFQAPNPGMSPPPMSGGIDSATMYMPQPMHQMPMANSPMQQGNMQYMPPQDMYRAPVGGATELS